MEGQDQGEGIANFNAVLPDMYNAVSELRLVAPPDIGMKAGNVIDDAKSSYTNAVTLIVDDMKGALQLPRHASGNPTRLIAVHPKCSWLPRPQTRASKPTSPRLGPHGRTWWRSSFDHGAH